AVGLAAEADRPEPVVDGMFRRRLPYAQMLPFVAFLTPDGAWITGYAGGTSVSSFSSHLTRAERALATWKAAQGARTQEPRPTTPPLPEVASSEEDACEECCKPTPRPPVRPENLAPPSVKPVPPRAPAPVARERTPAPVRQPEPIARRETPARRSAPAYPPPRLEGDPDARNVSVDGVTVLPPPRIVIRPPRPVHDSIAAPRPVAPAATTAATNFRRAEEAAGRDAWGEVLRLWRTSPNDPDLGALQLRAHEWAHERLAYAVRMVAESRYSEARRAVEAVQREMAGEPEAIDAARGLVAIQTAEELRHLNPEGTVAKVVRQNAYEEMRGTRWACLF
ncbi:MAG: hypothetical protein ACYTG6_17540, partial [Planctomycetota bacterium]